MKRTLLLCVLVTALTAMLMLPACAIPELYKVSVSGTPPIPLAPAFINYTLNCTADITVEIYESNAAGNTTWPEHLIEVKVRTAGPTSMAKGPHTFLWPCTDDDGAAVTPGYFVARLTASSIPSGGTTTDSNNSPWKLNKIVGTFKAEQNPPVTEYAPWSPGTADVWGYYGASINTNPDSTYGIGVDGQPVSMYGRVYAADVNYQEIYIWDADGTYIGTCDDSGIGWGSSGPWDTYVAKDGYVYVSDRTLATMYVFAPDGSKVGPNPITSNGPGAFYRGMSVRQTDDGITHIFHSDSAVIWHSTCSADHLTWSARAEACNPPGEVYGVWASPDCSYLLTASGADVQKWIKGTGWTYTEEIAANWNPGLTGVYDVCETPDGWHLWVGRGGSQGTVDTAAAYTIYKYWKDRAKDAAAWAASTSYALHATVGPPARASWAASTSYSVNQFVKSLYVIPDITRTTAYNLGEVRTPSATHAYKYECTTAGTTGAIVPAWPTPLDSTVTDGTVVWTNRGYSSNNRQWKCTTAGTSGATEPVWAIGTGLTTTEGPDTLVWTYAGTINTRKYVCTTAGTSGSIEPSWPGAFGTATDGTVVWTETTTVQYRDNRTPSGERDFPWWVKGVQCDSVGNVLITYGKSAYSWPSYYWAIGAEGNGSVAYTATKQTGPFEVTADPAPVVVPGSAIWTYSDPSGKLWPDDTATAKVDFKVLDANGFTDIASVKVDRSSLRLASDAGVLVDVDSLVADTTDVNGLTGLCSATLKAVVGARAGVHTDINISPWDLHKDSAPPDGPVPATSENYPVDVLGCGFTGTVKHIEHSALVAGATMTILGGKTGVYGYPFTYTTGLTDANGQASQNLSEGPFTVVANKLGYQSQTPQALTVLPGDIGGTKFLDVNIGPITIAQAKALPGGTEASVAGVCYAQPKGLDYPGPTMAYGLDHRIHSVLDTTGIFYNQWYMCDPGDPANGMLFHLKITDDPNGYLFTWDDPGRVDDNGVNMYIGPRPAEGRLIWVKGSVGAITGYEKRFVVKESDFMSEYGMEPQTFNRTYWNKDAAAVPAPAARTIAQIYHPVTFITTPANWGTYAQITGAKVVKWWPGAGKIPENADYTIAYGEEAVDAIIVMDDSYNWCVITPQTLTSLNITANPPVDVGDIYTFTGAGGRHARGSVGSIRVRKTADMLKTTDNTPPAADNMGSIRGAFGSGKNLQGIVTAKFTDYIYVESADRSSGAKVIASAAAQAFVKVGDRVWFTGGTGTELVDGQKQITPTTPFVIVSTGNALPYLGMRARDVGGRLYGANDPGVTNGFGALNVGLYVTVHGLVTYRDTSATPAFFYIWDGGNRGGTKLHDGNPVLTAYGIRVNHSGLIGTLGVVPWTDWVEIEGVVSVNQTAVVPSTIPELIPVLTPKRLTAGLLAPGILAADFTDVTSPAGTIVAGKNLFGLPYAPGNVGNGASNGVLQAYDPAKVFAPKTESNIQLAKLTRWDSVMSSWRAYNAFAEPHGPFGGMLLGDGYWLKPTAEWTISYKARVQNIPQWIAPGAAGRVMIANPVNDRVMLDPVNYVPTQPWDHGIMMSDGGQVVSFRQARSPVSGGSLGWITTKGSWWSNLLQSWRTIGCNNDLGVNTKIMEPWMGIYFTWRPGFEGTSMIVPPGFPPP